MYDYNNTLTLMNLESMYYGTLGTTLRGIAEKFNRSCIVCTVFQRLKKNANLHVHSCVFGSMFSAICQCLARKSNYRNKQAYNKRNFHVSENWTVFDCDNFEIIRQSVIIREYRRTCRRCQPACNSKHFSGQQQSWRKFGTESFDATILC